MSLLEEDDKGLGGQVVLSAAGSNYLEWKDSITDTLAIKGLTSFVTVSVTQGKAKDETDEAILIKEAVGRAKAMGFIRRSLGVNRSVIQGETNPIIALATIKAQFSQTSAYDVDALQERFIKLRPEGDEFPVYMTRLQAVVNGLAENSIIKMEAEVISQMVMRLGEYPEGHEYRKAHESVTTDLVKYGKYDRSFFERVVLRAYRNLQNQAVTVKDEEKAFAALASKFGYTKITDNGKKEIGDGRTNRGFGGVCRCCGTRGHKVYDCKERSANGCTFCGKAGHRPSNCSHPDSYYSRGIPNPGAEAKKEEGKIVANGNHASMASPSILYNPGQDAAFLSTRAYHTAISVKSTYLDSGCSHTMFGDKEFFETSPNYRPMRIPVVVGDGNTIYSEGMGDVYITERVNGRKGNIRLHNCYYVPGLNSNLVSVSHMDNIGYSVMFGSGKVFISVEGRPVLSGTLNKDTRLYDLDLAAEKNALQQRAYAITADR